MRPDRVLTPQDKGTRDRRMARQVRDGVPVSHVARAHKVDRRYVLDVCARMNVTVPSPRMRNWK